MSENLAPDTPDTPPGSVTVVQQGTPPLALLGSSTDTGSVPPRASGTGGPERYELLEEIARGGMGVVYLARDRVLDRDVGVKTLLNVPAAESVIAARFREEARITGQLQHPNIPPVHDLGTLPDGRPYLAMKLIKGRTLDAMLKDRPDPSHDRGKYLAIFEQIAQGVAYAHAHRVIHRDLKPMNVMVGAFGEVQVMDWGLAKILPDSPAKSVIAPQAETGAATDIRPSRDESDETRPGSIFGTPAYMPREQAIGAVDQIDTRSDVFSLGGVLCVILTGKPPYIGTDAESTRQLAAIANLDDAFTRIDSCGAEPDLIALCKRCLSAERDDRPRHANEVAKAVADLRAEAERRARQAEMERARAESQAIEQRKRRKVQLALAAVVLLLCAGGGGFAWWQDRQAAERKLADERNATERERAEAERLRIDGERKAAEARADAAEQERKKIEALNAKIESIEYGRTIQVAHQEWRDGNIVKARALLADTKPELRGWEYQYLHRLCNSELLSFQPHATILSSAAYNSDGTRIVTAGFGKPGSVRVWDAKSGQERLTLKVEQSISSVSFSPDDTRIAGLNDNSRTVHVWDAKTGDELLVLKGRNGVFHPETFVTYSPDGTRIVTGSWDKTARVWDAKTGAELFALKGHTYAVRNASFNTDGTRIVTAGGDMTAKVWDAKTGEVLLTLKGHARGVHSAWFSPDGKRIVTGAALGVGTDDEPARVWDAETGKEIFTIKGHAGALWCLSCSKDGTRVVTGGGDKTARVWDAKTGAELLTLKGHTRDVRSAFFSPDGTRIVTASDDRTVKVWDANTGTEYRPVSVHGTVYPAFFSPDGARFIALSLDERVKVCDALTGKTVLSLDGHATRKPGDFFGSGSFGLKSASYSADGTRIVTASDDKTARVWDAKTGDQLASLKLTGWANSAESNSDGTRVVTASEGKVVKVWDTKTNSELFTLSIPSDDPKNPATVSFAAFTPDGKRIVTVGNHVRFWDALTGDELLVLEKRTASFVRWVAFSPDGTRMITAGGEQTPKVWDVATGTVLLTLKGHMGGVTSAFFHPDGTRIVTAGHNNNTATVWDAKTGAELLTLKVPRETVVSAMFSPGDGSRILTASHMTGLIKIWDSRPVVESVREREAAENGQKE